MINATLFSVLLQVITEINHHENGECSLATLQYYDDTIYAMQGSDNQFPFQLVPANIRFYAYGQALNKQLFIEYYDPAKLLHAPRVKKCVIWIETSIHGGKAGKHFLKNFTFWEDYLMQVKFDIMYLKGGLGEMEQQYT